MRYTLTENKTGCNGKIVYTITVDDVSLGNILIPYTGNKYELYFSDEQTAYKSRQAVKASCWGAVIRCIDQAIATMPND
jgi:hypothetical protein